MFSRRLAILALACALFVAGPGRVDAQAPASSSTLCPSWTVDDLLSSPAPFALGHRGYGQNLVDTSRPIENTLDAFRHGFMDGIRVVEMDLQRTADGKIVVFHDDYLSDYTCVSSLTYEALLAREPQVPLFRAVLNAMRHFDRSDALSGILLAEIKVPVPLCDGANTSAAAAASEGPLVAAVLDEIRQAHMEQQVVINSESPSILAQVQSQAPDMPRALTLNALQLLSPDEVFKYIGIMPELIAKNDFGLEWYNIGPIARLPRYLEPGQFVQVTLLLGSRAVSLDKQFLQGAGDDAAGFIALLHSYGVKAVVWTIDTADEWEAMKATGVDGITTNNIAYGLANQASLSEDFVCAARDVHPQPGTSRIASPTSEAPLALSATRAHPFVDGRVHVAFLLDHAAPARLALYDVAGRSVESREVGVLGAGLHELALGDALAPGVYLVRLSEGAKHQVVKAVIAR